MVKRRGIKRLPKSIILNKILPRLPARSAGRFTLVCKQWKSFLVTPRFSKMQLLNNIQQRKNKKLLLVTPLNNQGQGEGDYFQTIDCEQPQLGLSPKRSLPFKIGANGISVISSLHGLVCLGIKASQLKDQFSDIILWNPLTADYKTLPKANNIIRIFPRIAYGLYCTSCDHENKLLWCVKQTNMVVVYSWKTDKFRFPKAPDNLATKTWHSNGVFLSGNLYFLVQEDNDGSFSITRFNTETEIFTEIPTPSDTKWKCCDLKVFKGHIYLSRVEGNNCLVLWKMMDRDGSWNKKRTFFESQPIMVMAPYEEWSLVD